MQSMWWYMAQLTGWCLVENSKLSVKFLLSLVDQTLAVRRISLLPIIYYYHTRFSLLNQLMILAQIPISTTNFYWARLSLLAPIICIKMNLLNVNYSWEKKKRHELVKKHISQQTRGLCNLLLLVTKYSKNSREYVAI